MSQSSLRNLLLLSSLLSSPLSWASEPASDAHAEGEANALGDKPVDLVKIMLMYMDADQVAFFGQHDPELSDFAETLLVSQYGQEAWRETFMQELNKICNHFQSKFRSDKWQDDKRLREAANKRTWLEWIYAARQQIPEAHTSYFDYRKLALILKLYASIHIEADAEKTTIAEPFFLVQELRRKAAEIKLLDGTIRHIDRTTKQAVKLITLCEGSLRHDGLFFKGLMAVVGWFGLAKHACDNKFGWTWAKAHVQKAKLKPKNVKTKLLSAEEQILASDPLLEILDLQMKKLEANPFQGDLAYSQDATASAPDATRQRFDLAAIEAELVELHANKVIHEVLDFFDIDRVIKSRF